MTGQSNRAYAIAGCHLHMANTTDIGKSSCYRNTAGSNTAMHGSGGPVHGCRIQLILQSIIIIQRVLTLHEETSHKRRGFSTVVIRGVIS